MFRTTPARTLVGLLLALLSLAGCANDAQTGTAIGAGIGAIAGQAIGGNTEGTLIGAAVGAGAGYIIGNERDKAAARNDQAADPAPRRDAVAPSNAPRPQAAPTNPLVGSAWRIVSITGDPAPEQYASIIVTFRTSDTVNTVITYRDGGVESTNERYLIDGDRITIWGDDHSIDGRWRLEGDVLIVTAPDFRAVGERLDP